VIIYTINQVLILVEYEIIEITDSKLIHEVVEVQRLAWGRDAYSLVPPSIIRSLITHGGVIFGAITPDNQLIGYVFGFPALGKAEGKENFLYHHSNQIGVLPSYQNVGIGTALKQKQKGYCISMGFPVLTWTYDPLVSTNSQVNFKHLNTIGRTYHVNYYGPRSDVYNAELPTDRIEVELWLIPNIENSLLSLKEKIKVEIQGQQISSLWSFKCDPLPEPETVTIDESADYFFIPVPGDFLIVKKSDLDHLLKWRYVIREAYKKLIKLNYVCIDFLRSKDTGEPSTLIWAKSPFLERLTPKFLQDT
jgi:predicted GNAT superfamily acetyltransferase